MNPTIKIALSGGTPGADSNDYTLFDSTVAMRPGTLPHTGIKRITFGGQNAAAGTLKAYFSNDKGVTFRLYSSISVAAATTGAPSGPIDYDVAPYADWKLVWTNGGSAQTTWDMHLAGHTDRALGA